MSIPAFPLAPLRLLIDSCPAVYHSSLLTCSLHITEEAFSALPGDVSYRQETVATLGVWHVTLAHGSGV